MKSSFHLFFLFLCSAAWCAEPLVNSVLPRGGQRDSEETVLLKGNRLLNPEAIFFYTKGITATNLELKSTKEIKATFKISKDAQLGQHEFRLRTKNGMSKLWTFWVGPFPNLKEEEPNSSFEEAQPVPNEITVNGTITNEDVDYFEINATKGQRISVEIEAIRLSGAMFDPYVAILDAKRFELAASDDSELLLQDSTTSVLAPEDGIYRIEVRESSYRGGNNFHYRLHIGSFPRPLVVFPAGGQAGKSLSFEFIGDPKGKFKKTLTLPDDGSTSLAFHADENGSSSPSPNRILINSFPSIREQEPNPSIKEATNANAYLPLAFDGVIEKDGDIDNFRFKAKKGDRFYIKAHARSVASPLDPVISLYQVEGGSRIRGNDDANNGPDSLITQNFNKDAEYVIRISDHLGKGSPKHIYRIETIRLEPEFSASIPMFGNRDSQTRQMLPIPRGNRVATSLTLTKKNFTGELDFLVKNLPPGVSAEIPKAPSNFTSVPLLLKAESNASLCDRLLDLDIIHVDKNDKRIEGDFRHQVELVYGPPNNRSYYDANMDRLAVAVVEPVPFRIKLHPPSTPIVKGGSINLKVEVIRDANFTKDVTVKILTRPPGIGARGSLKIAGKDTIGYYPLTANGASALGIWDIGMQGEAADEEGGQFLAASEFVGLKVEEPYVSLKINMPAIQRGQDGQMLCNLLVKRPFEGKAKLELRGLPAFSTTEPIEFDANSSEIQFPIKVEDKARAGITKNLFCFAKVPFNGKLITHTVGQGGQIRLDNPPPKPKAPKPSTVSKTKPTPKVAKKEKPLSRLEQLRLAAQGK
ncbi:MAG: PPC domain-containing protein [Opitutales bacterium]